MLGLQPLHLLIILIVAIILFGPKGLPEIGRMLGRALGEFREASEQVQKPIQQLTDTVKQTLAEPPLLVFVSSIMNREYENLEAERAEAKKAIEAFPPLTRAWRFEDSPAFPQTAKRVYLKKVEECDIFVLVVGKQITWAVLREYATARKHSKPCLVFLKRCERMPATQRFIEKIRTEVKYAEFSAAEDLAQQIGLALASHLILQARRYKLSANDIAVLSLFLEQLPITEIGKRDAEKIDAPIRTDTDELLGNVQPRDAANICRLRAVQLFNRAREQGVSFAKEAGVEEALLTDLLRRTGKWDEANRMCREGLKRNPKDNIRKAFVFQMALISQRDRNCHTFGEVIGEEPERTIML